jgi:23S rRNA (uridine2552-2'-O)-methyltransferase
MVSKKTHKGGGGKRRSSAEGERLLHVPVRTARGRKLSSIRWLERQLNDPYVHKAKREGYRSRAAYKLLEMEEMFHLFTVGASVIDLGAAPGGWSQIAYSCVTSRGMVIGVDLLPIDPLEGITFIQGDFLEEGVDQELVRLAGGKVNVVMSDMAASSCGHAPTDHCRIMTLCESALLFAFEVLKPGGHFIAKILQGGTERHLLTQMKQNFQKVKHVKPPASRADSAEMYVVAIGFRGHQLND